MVLEPKGMLNVEVLVLLNVRVGWLLVAGAEVLRLLLKPLKPVALLLVAVGAAVGRDWVKVVTVVVVVVGRAGGLPNWKMEPMAGVKLAAEAGGAPKRKGCEVAVAVLVVVLTLLLTLFTPKPNAGFEAESADGLAVVMVATAEAVVARPVKSGAVVAGAVAGVVCLNKGAGKGTDAGGPMLLNTGWKVRAVVLVAVGREELEGAVAGTDGSGGVGPAFSLLGGAMKMGLNMGDAEDSAGAAGLEIEVLCVPNRKLCLGAGGGADVAWGLAAVSA